MSPELSEQEGTSTIPQIPPDTVADLMRQHNQRLFRLAFAVLRDRAEAEDAVQQAYLSAFLNLGQLQDRSSFGAWVNRITLREAISRARRMPQYLEEPDESTSKHSLTPQAQAERKQTWTLIETAINELPHDFRLVFVMREIQGMTTSETAACLNTTAVLVKVRLFRAKRMLKQKLGHHFEAKDAFVFLGADCKRLTMRVIASLNHTAFAK